jgi:L-arabinonolactonase
MSTTTATLLKIIPCQCQLGEGVLWHDEQQAIYWLDIEACDLYRYYISSEVLEKFTLPQRMASFAFTPVNNQIIAAFEQGFARYNFITSKIDWINQPELHIKGNRLNDGRVDKQGRFWAGSMVESTSTTKQKSALYCVDHQLNCHKKMDDLLISNSLCWNKAGDILYHADSPSHQIFQYDFCKEKAAISNKKLFATTNASTFPDGSIVDAQDYLWNAQWGSGKVIRYNCNGEIDLSIVLPVSQPSCVTIGGENLDWLIITSAKQGLSSSALTKEPLSGNLFIYQLTGASGLVDPQCTICLNWSS